MTLTFSLIPVSNVVVAANLRSVGEANCRQPVVSRSSAGAHRSPAQARRQHTRESCPGPGAQELRPQAHASSGILESLPLPHRVRVGDLCPELENVSLLVNKCDA